jgi:cytochrome c
MRNLKLLTAVLFCAVIFTACSNKRSGPPKVLVFTKCGYYPDGRPGFHHASIPDGVAAIQKLGEENGFEVDTTSDSTKFTEDTLKQYAAVIFMSTTGNVLNNYQQQDFERYIEAGGGYVGIHAAADCEYKWPWYGKLVGAYFKEHPQIQEAKLIVHKDPNFPVTDSLPNPWIRTDEWYNWQQIPQDVHVLVSIDESSYKGGTNGKDHPMVWYHDYDGGRAFYMELGHTSESYTEPNFLKLLLAGINYAIGNNNKLDYSKVTALRVPAEDRFTKVELAGGLDEPTEITVLPNLDVLVAERKGNIKWYDAKDSTIKIVAHLDVYDKTDKPNTNVEMGLLGMQRDPNYNENHWIYVYYSPMDTSVDRLSRFKFENGKFDLKSEQIILQVPTERDMCCHTGGSIAFNQQGDLFVSVGDNTTPFDEVDSVTGKAYPINTHGYAPLDDRPGFDHYDDRRSAGNSNDLRGKILRIKVNADGSYSIPSGNLFPKGEAKTRPEIYVMGDRNPYRISVDQHTGYLYWGEVGPDADNDSMATRGPRGYDEINQARKAGNFGWPYFVGNNFAYREYNYATGVSGPAFDPNHVVNDSKNNTGLTVLPPAQPAFIWYPYAHSSDFPILGAGGRCSMAGPVYYTDDYPAATRYPEYYNGKLFIYDWIRNWIMVVTMNKDGDLQTIEPFMQHTKFHNISDMEAGPDGRLYEVEYGEGWFQKNPDAALYVINYNGGNIPPQVSFQADTLAGALPLTVHLSAKGTYDPNGESLTYNWNLGAGNKTQTTAPETSVTFNQPGEYDLSVNVTDSKGSTTNSKVIKIYAGNSIPQVHINIAGNQTFYFPNGPIPYAVKVFDKEDGSSDNPGFDKSNVLVKVNYAAGLDKAAIPGQQEAVTAMSGKSLMESLDCKSCHKIDAKSIGPAFEEVAAKYKNDPKAMDYLPHKIITGGSGVWGQTAMAAHPNLSVADASQIVSWILSLADTTKANEDLPMQGVINPSKGYSLTDNGSFLIMASYTDKGANGVRPLTGSASFILENPEVQADAIPEQSGFADYTVNDQAFKVMTGNEGWLALPDISLTNVHNVEIQYGVQNKMKTGYKITMHLDAPDGKVLGSAKIGASLAPMKIASANIPITAVNDNQLHTVYWVVQKADTNSQQALGIATLKFEAK